MGKTCYSPLLLKNVIGVMGKDYYRVILIKIRRIANLQIHVERAIEQLNTFSTSALVSTTKVTHCKE